RNFWVDIEHSELGTTLTYPGNFVKASGTPCQFKCRAPLIGEHNRQILGEELGYSTEALMILKQNGVI
ncbi:MAG: CoA transferase, partial [Chloroflexota bacterium]|nr:CoA transferase [Chloroflexota bacterium]